MIQLTPHLLTGGNRGYYTSDERDADIDALRGQGFDHFTTYRDAGASIALSYGITDPGKRRVRHAVQTLIDYWGSYPNQGHYDTYADGTIIDDALYGVAIGLDRDKYHGASGYRDFLENVVVPHLRDKGIISET